MGTAKDAVVRRPLVLAVDDDSDNLWLLSMALELFGIAHICLQQGKWVSEAAQRYQPDLVLLDLILADISGLDVAAALKQSEETAKIPIVGVTAMVSGHYPARFMQGNLDDILSKPYMLEDLRRLLDNYLLASSRRLP